MCYGIKQFCQDIQDCLQLAKNELNNRKNGINGESTIEQLEIYIIPDLSKVLSDVISREPLPPNTQQYRYIMSFGYAFKLWGWDMSKPSDIYLKLAKLNENYRKIQY